MKVEFWDDHVTSTPAGTEHANCITSGDKRATSSPVRKYPELLPISEIHRMESNEEVSLPGSRAPADPERLCAVAPSVSGPNGLIQLSGSMPDTTLTNGSVSVMSMCEGDSTILYGSGLAVQPPSPHPIEHAHSHTQSRDRDSKAPVASESSPVVLKGSPLPSKSPVAMETEKISESPIPDTPPLDGSPLMFDSGSSSETNLIFAEAGVLDFEHAAMEEENVSSTVEKEKKELVVSEAVPSPMSSHSWHTPPEEIQGKSPCHDGDGIDGVAEQEGEKAPALPQSQSLTADTIILGEEDAGDENVSQESDKTLPLSQSRGLTTLPPMGQPRIRRPNLRLSARKSHRLASNVSQSIASLSACLNMLLLRLVIKA